jgi:hypothetical protein
VASVRAAAIAAAIPAVSASVSPADRESLLAGMDEWLAWRRWPWPQSGGRDIATNIGENNPDCLLWQSRFATGAILRAALIASMPAARLSPVQFPQLIARPREGR